MQNINYAFLLSRPVWGAWIEISNGSTDIAHITRRAPYGARGLKLNLMLLEKSLLSRAPYGARGLKYHQSASLFGRQPVAPRMGRVD